VILPMVQVELLGPRQLLAAALRFLQGQGVLQLREPEGLGAGPAEGHGEAPAGGEGPAREARLAALLARLEALLARVPGRRRAAPPAAPLPPPDDEALPEALDALGEQLDDLSARRAALLEEQERTATFSRLVVAVAPLHGRLEAALQPELHGLVLKRDPAALALLEAEVRRLTGGRCAVAWRELDEAQVGVLMEVPRAAGRELSALLFERGVEEVRPPGAVAGRGLVEGLLAVAGRQRAIPSELAALDAGLEAWSAEAGAALAAARDEVAAALERARAAGRCGTTRFAFVVAGWMAAERVPALRRATVEAWGDQVALLVRPPPRATWGDVPVVLRNRPLLRPFERLLALVPLPRYGSVDPTPFLALFFPFFLGLVMGDVAFGLLAAGLALLARWRRWGGAAGRDLAAVALACAGWSLVFGLVFGEALGGLGAHLGLHPLLDRRRALLLFLGLALAVGLGHVLLGGLLGVVSSARNGHRREAVARAGHLVALGAGAAALCARLGPLPPRAFPPALAVAGAGLLAATLAAGPLAALEVVLAFGHVLSYARLMALGLASLMLAEVANGLAASLPGPGGLLLAVLVHAVNFTLCLVSPIVAALRLHYVEFFERFYDEGGHPWRPFALPEP